MKLVTKKLSSEAKIIHKYMYVHLVSKDVEGLKSALKKAGFKEILFIDDEVDVGTKTLKEIRDVLSIAKKYKVENPVESIMGELDTIIKSYWS